MALFWNRVIIAILCTITVYYSALYYMGKLPTLHDATADFLARSHTMLYNEMFHNNTFADKITEFLTYQKYKSYKI